MDDKVYNPLTYPLVETAKIAYKYADAMMKVRNK